MFVIFSRPTVCFLSRCTEEAHLRLMSTPRANRLLTESSTCTGRLVPPGLAAPRRNMPSSALLRRTHRASQHPHRSNPQSLASSAERLMFAPSLAVH